MWILYVLTIASSGMSDVNKIPVPDMSVCQRQAADVNTHISLGTRYYAFCYDAKEETR